MPEDETEVPQTEVPQTEVTADECYNKLAEIVQWLKVVDGKISAISTKIG
ncbi:MAG: hypothetical protein AB7E37_08225 [Candidatus Altimarinota bacterium]